MAQEDASQNLFGAALHIASKRGLLKAGVVPSTEKSRSTGYSYALVDRSGRLILRVSIEELTRVSSYIAWHSIVGQIDDAIGRSGCAILLILACLVFPPLAIIIIFAVWPRERERSAKVFRRHRYIDATYDQSAPHSAKREESLVYDGEESDSQGQCSSEANKGKASQVLVTQPDRRADDFNDASGETRRIPENHSGSSTPEITYLGSSGYGTWVRGSYRRSTYVGGYINKRGKWVNGFFRSSSYVRAHYRRRRRW